MNCPCNAFSITEPSPDWHPDWHAIGHRNIVVENNQEIEGDINDTSSNNNVLVGNSVYNTSTVPTVEINIGDADHKTVKSLNLTNIYQGSVL